MSANQQPELQPAPRRPATLRSSKSTRTTFAILGYLDRHRDQGASLARAAADLGMPRETLRPYLQGLIAEQKVYLDPLELHYHLDPDAPVVRPTQADEQTITKTLEQFAADTRHDIALAVLTPQGLRLPIYVEPREGPTLLCGLRRDAAHATSSGHALLSGRPTWYLRRFFDRVGMPALTDATPTSIEELLPHLRPRSRGIWSAHGQYAPNGACIAVIARESHYTSARFALTTSVLLEDYHLERHRLRDRLLLTAGELQTALGPLDILRTLFQLLGGVGMPSRPDASAAIR